MDLLGGVLEASWRGLGGLLASLGSALGASWAILERRRGILEASWSVLRTAGMRTTGDFPMSPKRTRLFWGRFYSHKTVF